MITIEQTNLTSLMHDPAFPALCREYADESSIDGMPPVNPSWDLYSTLERSGGMRILRVLWYGELIGFCVTLHNLNPHYGRIIMAIESIFVTKAHRTTGAGLKLIKAAERMASEVGATGIFFSSPITGALGRVLDKIGYRQTNIVHFRRVP